MKETDINKWATLMIERIETISKDWSKPWITEDSLGWPKNLSGREYNGMNALMLLLHCEKNGYKIPRFCTFDCVQRLNKPTEKQAKEGVELPRVVVNRGEKSFPVMLTTFTCIHKETKEKIKYDDYKRLSDEDKKMYNVYPKMQVFRVFNVSQTNLQEARPELWNKLANGDNVKLDESEKMSFEPMDIMIRDNRWICPIKPMHQDKAYFSITKNEIVVPEKAQFKDGESYYGTLWHEMTHSTGIEGQLNRIKPTAFGSDEYAREELVAELGSALVAQRYGMSKALKEESCAYLKSWLEQLKESPQFIKTTLLDVKKATSLVTQNVDKITEELEKEKKEEQDNKQAVKVEQTASGEKIFYSSVAYLQSTDDTSRLDEFRNKGNYEGLLQAVKEYYDGNGINEQYTFASPLQNKGDDLLIEDKDFAVVYNNSVGGTYEVMLKYSEQEIQDHITRNGTRLASYDIKEVAKDMVAEQFKTITKQRIPAFEMPSGNILYAGYNRETDTLDVGTATNAGLAVNHSFPYNHDNSLESNLQSVHSELSQMEQYQEEEVEYSGGMHR